MKFILAKKEGMTRIFGEDGRARAGTILTADPITVIQVKTKDGKDAYSAIQVGMGTRRVKNVSKAVLGHTKGKGYEAIREFRTGNAAALGDGIDASIFAIGDTVRVSGLTKGKGFAGVVKRHGFHGGPRPEACRARAGLYRRLGRPRGRPRHQGDAHGRPHGL